MSPLPVNLMVVVLSVWKKQRTGVVNLLTVAHQGTSCPQGDRQIQIHLGWESESVVFCPCGCRKYSH